MITVSCVTCGRSAAGHADIEQHRCVECGDILEATRRADGTTTFDPQYEQTLWRYRHHLPVPDDASPVTLGEGMTPLRRCPQLDDVFESPVRVWIKDETNNPTGSFKDRLVSVAITHARERGASVVTCASSGNAAASTAAYAASAGMASVVFVPASTPPAKVNQARTYGAQVVAVPGDYSNSYLVCDAVGQRLGWANLTTTYLNPYGTAGLATVGHELVDQFAAVGETADLVAVPLGSGPLLYGIDRGWREAAPTTTDPASVRLLGVQAQGCAPIVAAFESGCEVVEPWIEPSTIASGISDPLRGYPEDGTLTLRIIRRVGGSAVAVTDESIRDAAAQLARRAGVLAEPTGAASLAGVAEYVRRSNPPADTNVVVCVTGHGFKDPGQMSTDAYPMVDVSADDTASIVAAGAQPNGTDESPLLRLQETLRLEGDGA